ncbi:MAG TPA: carboxylating nicotinate-nucleotide diphosphorylase [Elusimicrobiota bacterium]|nr:carboxylating nicotinate-nucleotide diphosphorylase [Elusimicrobiota bacterium]
MKNKKAEPTSSKWDSIIHLSLREDRTWNDVTSRRFIPDGLYRRALIVSRAPGVACGVGIVARLFRRVDRRCRVRVRVRDGEHIRPDQTVMEVVGPLRALLAAERTALNFLTHLSGISTATHRFVRAVRGTHAKIYDTRKTIPGLRHLHKYAVRCGGGFNHRMDLSRYVFIKENHLSLIKDEKQLADLFRQIGNLRKAKRYVAMEAQNKQHILWAVLAGVDLLIFDNFHHRVLPGLIRTVRRFCRERRLRCPELEVSGNVSLDNVRPVALTGPERISVGRITHSAPQLNMSMEILPE